MIPFIPLPSQKKKKKTKQIDVMFMKFTRVDSKIHEITLYVAGQSDWKVQKHEILWSTWWEISDDVFMICIPSNLVEEAHVLPSPLHNAG